MQKVEIVDFLIVFLSHVFFTSSSILIDFESYFSIISRVATHLIVRIAPDCMLFTIHDETYMKFFK